jgi:hypothetical protein
MVPEPVYCTLLTTLMNTNQISLMQAVMMSHSAWRVRCWPPHPLSLQSPLACKCCLRSLAVAPLIPAPPLHSGPHTQPAAGQTANSNNSSNSLLPVYDGCPLQTASAEWILWRPQQIHRTLARRTGNYGPFYPPCVALFGIKRPDLLMGGAAAIGPVFACCLSLAGGTTRILISAASAGAHQVQVSGRACRATSSSSSQETTRDQGTLLSLVRQYRLSLFLSS